MIFGDYYFFFCTAKFNICMYFIIKIVFIQVLESIGLDEFQFKCLSVTC